MSLRNTAKCCSMGGSRRGRSSSQTYESNVFHHDFVQFGKQHSRYVHCFVTTVLWRILHLSYSSEPVMRLDYQIHYYWNHPPLTWRIARGGNAPPIPNVAPKIFRVIKVLIRKPKKYFSANQRHCLRNLLHQPLVERDQTSMLYQLSMINQTLRTWGSENVIQGGQW